MLFNSLPDRHFPCVVTPSLKLALVQVDNMRIAVGQQTLCTPLTTDTTFLVTSEDTRDAVSTLIAEARDGSYWLTLEEWVSRTS